MPPVASSSRRNPQSQLAPASDSESDTSRRRNRGANGQGKGRSRVIAGGSDSGSGSGGGPDNDDDENGALQGFTVDSFTSIPIPGKDRPTTNKISQIIRNLESLINNAEVGISRCIDTAIALEECREMGDDNGGVGGGDGGWSDLGLLVDGREVADDEEEEEGSGRGEGKIAKILDRRVKSMIDEHALLKIQIEVLEGIKATLDAGQEIEGIVQKYQQAYRAKEEGYRSKSDRAKYKNNKEFERYKTETWEVNHTVACPPMSAFLASSPNDESDDDDEIEMGGQTQTYRCPLTLMPLEDAHTSSKCHHSFSGEAIKIHIKQGGSTRSPSNTCPVAGCDKVLFLTDLKPDPALQKKADHVKRRTEIRTHQQTQRQNDAQLIE